MTDVKFLWVVLAWTYDSDDPPKVVDGCFESEDDARVAAHAHIERDAYNVITVAALVPQIAAAD